jgi:hypothetical protein
MVRDVQAIKAVWLSAPGLLEAHVGEYSTKDQTSSRDLWIQPDDSEVASAFIDHFRS